MQNPIYLLIWVTGMSALWFVWDIAIRGLLLDIFRERVFELRFELFRLAAAGQVDFDSEIYRTLETLFSGLIRFGHRVTFLTVIFSKVEQDRAKRRKDYVDVGLQIALQISRLNPELQRKMNSTLSQLHRAILLYAAFTSLLFLAAYLSLTVAKWLRISRPDTDEVKFSDVIASEAFRAELRRAPELAPA